MFFSRNLHFTGIGESSLEEIIAPVTASHNPTVAPYAGEGEVRLRVTASAETKAEAERMCDEMIEKIKGYGVAKYLYSINIPSLEATLVKRLCDEGLTLSVAESCTGGLISKRLTDIPGVSSAFLGGVVSYDESVKTGVLGVKEETIKRFSAVSAETAREMADGVRHIMGSDIGVSTTGYAGPGGGSEKDPVGTVYVAVSTKEKTIVKRLSYSSLRDRVFIRRASSSMALGMVLSVIGNEEFNVI